MAENTNVLAVMDPSKGLPDYLFYCPGCKQHHGAWTTRRNGVHAIWSFNGDMVRPTFGPSMKIMHPSGAICHFFIRNGMIEFLNDCTHDLKGQTVPMLADPLNQ